MEQALKERFTQVEQLLLQQAGYGGSIPEPIFDIQRRTEALWLAANGTWHYLDRDVGIGDTIESIEGLIACYAEMTDPIVRQLDKEDALGFAGSEEKKEWHIQHNQDRYLRKIVTAMVRTLRRE